MGYNFITKYLIDEIEKLSKDMKYGDFFIFDVPITDGSITYDKTNKWSIYQKDKNIPQGWYRLQGDILVEVYQKLKNNQGFLQKDSFFTKNTF